MSVIGTTGTIITPTKGVEGPGEVQVRLLAAL